MTWRNVSWYLLLAALTGCGDDGRIAVVEQPGCDPLVPEVCAFPFPSTAFLEEDPATDTGYRVALTDGALPENARGRDRVRAWVNEADGFSRVTTFTTLFPQAFLDDSNLPTPFDLEASLSPDSPVQLLDLDTGERIPVWGELERRADTPDQQPLILRPMRGIPFGHRVAAIVTDSLRFEDGSTPAPPEPFRALRDDIPTDSDALEARRERFGTLFDAIEAAGVPRERLLLAWDAVIMSRGTAQAGLPAMIGAAAADVEAGAPPYTVTACYSNDAADLGAAGLGCEADDPRDDAPLNPLTWRRIYGTVPLPNFLDPATGRVMRNDAGDPVPSGTFEAEIVVNVPWSVRDATAGSVPVVTFGHGLLAEPATYIADDDDSEGQMVLADRLGAIFVGTRWTGLSSTDAGAAAMVVTDLDSAPAFADLLMQGMANQVMMIPFVHGALASDPLLEVAGGGGSLVDPTRVGYTGISQGGIFGTTFMAVSPYVKTGVLHVPSSGYIHLLPHSPEFALFQMILDGLVTDLNEQQLFFALAQRVFDAGDPINYVEHVVADPLTDLGPKNALWQCSVGDMLAPWFGCDMLVRTAGHDQVAPATWPTYGVGTFTAPTAPGASGLQYYDPQLGVPELTTASPEAFGAHKALRRNPEVHAQDEAFFAFDDPASAGTIINPCGGECVIDPVPVN